MMSSTGSTSGCISTLNFISWLYCCNTSNKYLEGYKPCNRQFFMLLPGGLCMRKLVHQAVCIKEYVILHFTSIMGLTIQLCLHQVKGLPIHVIRVQHLQDKMLSGFPKLLSLCVICHESFQGRQDWLPIVCSCHCFDCHVVGLIQHVIPVSSLKPDYAIWGPHWPDLRWVQQPFKKSIKDMLAVC